MKIFILGGTGVIGRYLIPLLVSEGHEITALVRSAERISEAEKIGAKGVPADLFNEEELISLIKKTEPEIIIHQLTALAGVTGNFRKFDQEFELTNRFRTVVTDTLLKAAELTGVRRFIAQSFCGWPFAREGGLVKTEEDPLDPDPPASLSRTLNAIKHLESAVKKSGKVEALALRYGLFYGPGTSIAMDGAVINLIKNRKFPIVGNGGGIWSFVHVQDAAGATVKAVSKGEPGIYNIVDNEPAPVSIWMPFLADALEVKPPRKIPLWVGKMMLGEAGISMMTKIRGGSNAKAKRKLGWEPVYASWRDGFVNGL